MSENRGERVLLTPHGMSLRIVNPPTHPIVEEHAHVRALVAATVAALTSPPALPAEDPIGALHVDEWRTTVRERCASLTQHLTDHFKSEEASPMYTGGAEFMRFEARLADLRAEHDEIREGLRIAADAVRNERPEVAARMLHDVLEVIVQHEEAENEILQSALTADIGGGD